MIGVYLADDAVDIPSREYSAQVPANPVTKGTRPIRPHMDLGPITVRLSNPTPTIIRSNRSFLPTLCNMIPPAGVKPALKILDYIL